MKYLLALSQSCFEVANRSQVSQAELLFVMTGDSVDIKNKKQSQLSASFSCHVRYWVSRIAQSPQYHGQWSSVPVTFFSSKQWTWQFCSPSADDHITSRFGRPWFATQQGVAVEKNTVKWELTHIMLPLSQTA